MQSFFLCKESYWRAEDGNYKNSLHLSCYTLDGGCMILFVERIDD